MSRRSWAVAGGSGGSGLHNVIAFPNPEVHVYYLRHEGTGVAVTFLLADDPDAAPFRDPARIRVVRAGARWLRARCPDQFAALIAARILRKESDWTTQGVLTDRALSLFSGLLAEAKALFDSPLDLDVLGTVIESNGSGYARVVMGGDFLEGTTSPVAYLRSGGNHVP